MRLSTLRIAPLLAPLLLALAPRADELTFHPKDDSKLAKQFTFKLDLELGETTFVVSGQDMSGEIPELTFDAELSHEIVDHYIKVEGGKPLELVREYVSSHGSYHALDESESADDIWDLDGKQVRFLWNEKEQRYDFSPATGEAEPEELEGLEVDMDLRSLLPQSSVSEGGRWELSGKQLARALLMGIDVEALSKLENLGALGEDEEDAELFAAMDANLLPELEKLGQKCKPKCVYSGRRTVADRDLAVIELEYVTSGTIDVAWLMRMGMIEGGDLEESEFKIDVATIEVKVEGKGELLWDAAAGHARGFDSTAKLELQCKLEMSVETDGETFDVEGAIELLGAAHWTMALP